MRWGYIPCLPERGPHMPPGDEATEKPALFPRPKKTLVAAFLLGLAPVNGF